MPWREADLAIYHPRSKWAALGVRTRDGKRVQADSVPAALLIPMGRNGPAFLAYENFKIYPQWNQSLNYAITAAYLATRLTGAPRYRPGRVTVQRLSNRRGFDSGGIDGNHGAKCRAAVKKAQLRFGLPAESYPSSELMDRLRR
mgnify:CR=1 FL=1